jgi:hypothetical protein
VIEKRTVERFDLQLEAFVSLPDSSSQKEAESLLTRDISMCGAFLMTEKPLPVGSKICVDMILAVGFDNQSRILPLTKKS